MSQTVIGLFENASQAQEAVQKLLSNGFMRENIDVSDRSTSGSITSTDYEDENKESGISKFFRSLFGNDDDEVKTYTKAAQRSGSIVTVHAQSKEEAEQAADLLDDCGAVDVNEHASKYGYDSSSEKREGTMDEGKKSIPIINEEMQVGKRMVETGGVRLRSRIVERPVEEKLRLREERVQVDRRSVDRSATEEDLKNFDEGQIEVIERAEVPVVSKEARVVEEVTIGKDVKERKETVSDTVRKTEVDIENIDKKDARN